MTSGAFDFYDLPIAVIKPSVTPNSCTHHESFGSNQGVVDYCKSINNINQCIYGSDCNEFLKYGKSKDYAGCVSTTITGKKCQAWNV